MYYIPVIPRFLTLAWRSVGNFFRTAGQLLIRVLVPPGDVWNRLFCLWITIQRIFLPITHKTVEGCPTDQMVSDYGADVVSQSGSRHCAVSTRAHIQSMGAPGFSAVGVTS